MKRFVLEILLSPRLHRLGGTGALGTRIPNFPKSRLKLAQNKSNFAPKKLCLLSSFSSDAKLIKLVSKIILCTDVTSFYTKRLSNSINNSVGKILV